MPAITLVTTNTLSDIYEKAAYHRTQAAAQATNRGDTTTATLNQQHAAKDLRLAAEAKTAA